MSDEGFEEEWDQELLDQLIKVEESALSSSSSSNPNPNHSILPLHQQCHQFVSYSPPRELSQRTTAFSRDSDHNQLEIDRLKRELARVSKQLEQERCELRKERIKKDGQLNNVSLNNGLAAAPTNTKSSSKAAGVQTENGGGFAQVFLNDDQPTCQDFSNKLLAIWALPSSQSLGRNLILNLLAACQMDLHVLFGCISANLPVKSRMDSPSCESSTSLVPKYHLHSCQSIEAAKVSHLYSVLTKVSNGMLHVDAMLEPLLDLCSLENVVIVHRSLCVLHMFLKHLLIYERKYGERENVMVDGVCSGNNVVNHPGSGPTKTRDLFSVSTYDKSCAGCELRTRSSDAETLFDNGQSNPGIAISVSPIDLVSLFEIMLQIALKNIEDIVRLEALSIMNLILIRSNAHMDREKFGRIQVFESISQFLRKEAGVPVQKLSIKLLYLLLNCPKLLVTFCCVCTEGESTCLMDNMAKDSSALQKFTSTLQGLADCIASCGNGLEELKLRRNAIILLAFLASSGNSGFDILVSHKLSKDASFLMLILQVLVSEMDAEATSILKSPEIFQERTLLMREALILLNRLVSNLTYSGTALQLLTKNRDMASLTIDIANRLSRKDQTRFMRESEVIDLARVFKKRVFAYMGDHLP
ncbi:hypothetical protein UlMin_002445 [Ulmus minor]